MKVSKVKQDVLREQVVEYQSLGFKAWRKQFAAILAFFAVTSFVFSGVIGSISNLTILASALCLLFAFFSSLGYRVAMVLGIILSLGGFVGSAILALDSGNSVLPIFHIIFFLIFLDVGWKAIKVEIERKKM